MPDTLIRGARGADVAALQRLLNQRLTPSPNLTVDGDFGARTEAAVRLYQATVGLDIDGIAGPRTRVALDRGLVTGPAAIAPVPATFPDAPWMKVAMGEIGQREVPGSRSNPRIIEYHATTTLRATADETAWCASFVNWCLAQIGVAGTNSAAAASWLDWGQPSHAFGGAITVIHSPAAARSAMSVSGNHVGFLVQESGSRFHLLGGNQSDQVKISSYPKSSWQLRGYRRPEA